MADEIQQNTVGTIEIKYTRPKFSRRVLANLIDLILFILVFLGLFSLTRYTVSTTPNYQNTISSLDQMKLDSALYVKRDEKIIDIVSYMNNEPAFNNEKKVSYSETAISKFLDFEINELDSSRFFEMLNKYNEDRLNAKFTDEYSVTYNMFTLDEHDNIIKNPDCFEHYVYPYRDFYLNYIDNTFQGYLATTPRYFDLTKTISNYLIWVEVPVGYILGVILVYFVPTLFFSHGRQTIGKLIYRIGSVDQNFLSPSFGRNAAKWSIFLAEMILGIFSFGIVFILSFTLMVFSKYKQGFPDYMLKIQEVDTTSNNIYKNKTEIALSHTNKNKKPTDFRLIDEP